MNMYILCVVGTFFISAICGFIFIPIILSYSKAKHLYDMPNARKIHNNAVSRLGGVSFVPSMFISLVIVLSFLNPTDNIITMNLWSVYFFISVMLIYGMGVIDDLLGLAPLTKFAVQIVSASILPIAGLYINNLYGFMGIHEIPYVIGFLLTVLMIVFIDNAINLIDGIDGLAASLSIIALGGFLFIFMRQGVWRYSVLIAGLIGVLVSFLYFNMFGKAEVNRKIFMGDSGSLTIGFIIGFLCVKYSMDNENVMSRHLYDFYLVFSLVIVPMFDVVRVFFFRLCHHQSPFVADKNHIHHKFMKVGFSQHKTLAGIVLLSLFYILLNYFLLFCVSNTCVFIIDVLIYMGLNLILNHFIMRKNRGQSI